jgi:hypothetical protein
MRDCKYISTIFNLSIRWIRVVSFTTQPLYPNGRSPRYPLCRRLGGHQSRSGRCGEKISCHCQESNLDFSAIEPYPVAMQTELSLQSVFGVMWSTDVVTYGDFTVLKDKIVVCWRRNIGASSCRLWKAMNRVAGAELRLQYPENRNHILCCLS